MLVPSAHPNCCAHHPSLSSSICVSPQRSSYSLLCSAFQKVYKGSNLKIMTIFIYLFIFMVIHTWPRGKKSLRSLCDSVLEHFSIIFFFLSSLSTSHSPLWEMMRAVLFATRLLTLPRASPCFDPQLCLSVGYLAKPSLTYMHRIYSGALVCCIMNCELRLI